MILHERSWFYKNSKKNLQIWSLYDQEVPITNYNYRLKRKKKVRAASFARHVAQRARVSRPLGALIRGEADQPTGCCHVVTRCLFRIYKMASSCQPIIVLAQLVLLASSQLWGGEFDSCLVLFCVCFWTGGKIKPENSGLVNHLCATSPVVRLQCFHPWRSLFEFNFWQFFISIFQLFLVCNQVLSRG